MIWTTADPIYRTQIATGSLALEGIEESGALRLEIVVSDVGLHCHFCSFDRTFSLSYFGATRASSTSLVSISGGDS